MIKKVKCTVCSIKKEHTNKNFYKRSTGLLDTRCKCCVKKKAVDRDRRRGILPVIKKTKEELNVANKIRQNRYRKKHRDTINEKARVRSKSTEGIKKRREYVLRNKDKIAAIKKKHYEENKSDYISRSNARRGLIKKQRISNKYSDELKEIYKSSKNLTEFMKYPFEVDHIIPINHPDVCGLHVPWNLQILIKGLNLTKTNKFDGTFSNDSWTEDI